MKHINRLALLITLVLMTSLVASAQPKVSKADREKWDREMREFKHDYFARELGLEESQKVKFFALYDAMDNELRAVRHEARVAQKELKAKGNAATDKDYEKVSEKLYELKGQENAIEMKYYEQFKTVLTTKQLYKLRDVENSFGELVRKHRHERKNRK